MSVKITPVEFADKWNRRLKAAIPDIRIGIGKVTESPMEKAAAQEDKMKAHLVEAIESGRWASELKKVTLADWKKAVLDVGVGRISSGADKAIPEVTEFAGDLIAHENANLPDIYKMPDLTLEDNIGRATEWIRRMAKFSFVRK